MAGTNPLILLSLTAILSTVLALVKSQKPPANLNNEFLKKSHPINMAERSYAQLLLLSAAALLVLFGEF